MEEGSGQRGDDGSLRSRINGIDQKIEFENVQGGTDYQDNSRSPQITPKGEHDLILLNQVTT